MAEVYYVRGLDRIRRERIRQILDEGYTAEHDDMHDRGELAWLAVHLASPWPIDSIKAWNDHDELVHARAPDWVSRDDHVRDRQLTIAGALIAAEIDRLFRLRTRGRHA